MKLKELTGDKHFKTAVTILLAGLTVAVSLIVVLNHRAAGYAAEAGRDARILGIRSLTHLGGSLWSAAAERKLMISWQELGGLMMQAEAYEKMTRGAEASLYRISRERLARVRELLSGQGAVTKPPYFNAQAGAFDFLQYYLDRVAVPATELLERQDLRKREGAFWGGKSDAYGTALAVMAVAVFLLTLSLVVTGRVRFIVSGSGLALALAVGIAVAGTALRTWRGVSEDSVRALALASADATRAQLALDIVGDCQVAAALAEKTGTALETVLGRDPDYVAAALMRSRSDGTLGEALLFGGKAAEGRTALERAATGYEAVIRSGRDDGYVRWSLGYAELLLGRTEEALQTLDKAQAALPDQGFAIGAVRAAALVTAGRGPEASAALETAIARALEHPLASDAISFRAIIKNLERWNETAPVEGLAGMVRRLKEASVCVAHLERAEPLPSKSELEAPQFVNPVYDARGEIQELPACTAFPRSTARAHFLLELKGMAQGQSIVSKVYWRVTGRPFWIEQPRLGKVQHWEGPEQAKLLGEVAPPMPEAGEVLVPGDYRLEIYVDGALKAVGRFQTL